MVERWVHLEQLGGDPWILPIWGAINEAREAGRASPITKDLGELGMHVSTRLNLLPTIVRRTNEGAKYLYEAVSHRGPEHEHTREREGIAFRIDDNIKYELLADIDALLFEFNSACALMNRLFEKLHRHADKPMPRTKIGKSIRYVLGRHGEDASWFVELDGHRNFFMHEGAPYIAVDVSGTPAGYDLLIMKENLKAFDDQSKFIRLSQINESVQGFRRSRSILQRYLVDLFAP